MLAGKFFSQRASAPVYWPEKAWKIISAAQSRSIIRAAREAFGRVKLGSLFGAPEWHIFWAPCGRTNSWRSSILWQNSILWSNSWRSSSSCKISSALFWMWYHWKVVERQVKIVILARNLGISSEKPVRLLEPSRFYAWWILSQN